MFFRQKTPDKYGHIHGNTSHISSNHQTIEQIFEDANTAGSGSGLPYLVRFSNKSTVDSILFY